MLPVTPDADTAQPDADTARDPSPDDVMAQCVAVQREARLWLKGITAFVAIRSLETDPNSAVQTASDQAHIAAMDRVARLMRSDEPE
jgi:hypothetical protein